MGTVTITNHPLIQHKLSILRDKNTGTREFRQLIAELAMLECYEATRDLPLQPKLIETPIGPCNANELAGRKMAIIPILRAGLGMVDGILNLVPSAKVGHIGMFRDPETHAPVPYYCKLPHDVEERDVLVLDPMLATGGSPSTPSTRSRRTTRRASASFASSPRRKACRRCRPRTRMLTSSAPRLTRSSTRTRTSYPDSATPATASSARSNLLTSNRGPLAGSLFLFCF